MPIKPRWIISVLPLRSGGLTIVAGLLIQMIGDAWMSEAQGKFSSGLPHETELRFLRNDGKYRWFLFRWNPIRDDQGRLTRWYVAGTDIEDRKQTEQLLQERERCVTRANRSGFMFENCGLVIVCKRLSSIVKVAPTDSTVLITAKRAQEKN